VAVDVLVVVVFDVVVVADDVGTSAWPFETWSVTI
jgi:hypothetical protein